MSRPKVLLFCTIVIAFFLRIYQLTHVPISLHGDEVGVGYNAYSLLTRGIDEYGQSWPLEFRADVAPIIFYATIPSVWILGPTDFAIRFPSVIAGTITIFFIYYATRELLIFIKKRDPLSHVPTDFVACSAALFLALSPWHVQISRIAHDASYGLLLQLVGVFLFFKSINKKSSFLLFASHVIFGASFYAYHSPRLTTPLLLLGLLWITRKHLAGMTKVAFFSGFVFCLFFLPSATSFLIKPFTETRIGGIHIFIREGNETIFYLPFKFVQNYISQFNPYYLFLSSSSMRYFNVQNVGLFYIFQLALIVLGFVKSMRIPTLKTFVLLLIGISVLPGALTLGTPNGGRILFFLPIAIFLCSVGLFSCMKTLRVSKRKVFLWIFLTIISIEIANFLHQYFNDSPTHFATQWQYGMKETAQEIVSKENEVDKIIVSDKFKQFYIYLLFFGQKDPLWLHSLINKTRHPFIGYTLYGKYEFRPINFEKDRYSINALLVGSLEDIPLENSYTHINNFNGEIVSVLYRTQ